MSIDAGKKIAARTFGLGGGALIGGGAAAIRFIWVLPPEGRGVAIFFLLGGVAAILLGIIASYISTSLLRGSRFEHVLQWVLAPALVAFAAGLLLAQWL